MAFMSILDILKFKNYIMKKIKILKMYSNQLRLLRVTVEHTTMAL